GAVSMNPRGRGLGARQREDGGYRRGFTRTARPLRIQRESGMVSNSDPVAIMRARINTGIGTDTPHSREPVLQDLHDRAPTISSGHLIIRGRFAHVQQPNRPQTPTPADQASTLQRRVHRVTKNTSNLTGPGRALPQRVAQASHRRVPQGALRHPRQTAREHHPRQRLRAGDIGVENGRARIADRSFYRVGQSLRGHVRESSARSPRALMNRGSSSRNGASRSPVPPPREVPKKKMLPSAPPRRSLSGPTSYPTDPREKVRS